MATNLPSSDLEKTGLIFVTAAAAPSYPLSSDKKISSSPFASPLQYLSLLTDQPPQLFEKGSGRNLKYHFGAFNTQWKLVSNWNPSLKYLSTLHFLTKMAEIFCGVKGDAKAAGNNFLRILDTLEMLENG